MKRLLGLARYELCAQYGLYVVDEANFETHGFDPSLRYNEMVPANNPQVWDPLTLLRSALLFGLMHKRPLFCGPLLVV
jgi:hypothetical protein